MARLLEYIFFLYFLSHIPITMFFDAQALLPKEWFPAPLQNAVGWYTRGFKDSLMVDKPPWFKSFIFCELLAQFPFFFVATYAYWKGAENCKWVRIPAIIYGTHVATTLVPIIAEILLSDFKHSHHPSPSTMEERLKLTAVYLPYLVIPILIVLHSVFSNVYVRRKQKAY